MLGCRTEMASELLDIDPRELKFTFELKKQSSCSVSLTNKTEQHVAFKVKTTSPKSYCVRPNAGIIPPKSTLDFTVILQPVKVVLADMQCRDKFLIQSTVAPSGRSDDEMKPELFTKDSGRYIEEKKLRVIFVSPPHSPDLQPLNRSLKQGCASQISISKEVTEAAPFEENPFNDGTSPKRVPITLSLKEDSVLKQSDSFKERSILNGPVSANSEGTKSTEELKFPEDVEELKSKIRILESQLIASEKMNVVLKEEKRLALMEREKVQQELLEKMNVVALKGEKHLALRERGKVEQELASMQHKHVHVARVGFPFLFVCFIGLVGITLGYWLRGE